MRFEKGHSGNPGGRPKGVGDIRELARQHTMTALATLAEIAERGENESARVAAANAPLERGWGKPAVPIVPAEAPEEITITFGNARALPHRDGDAPGPDRIENGNDARPLPLIPISRDG